METIKRFGLKGSVSAMMILAMVGSWGNVYAYLSSGHTNGLTTFALASLLGGGLVILSHGILYMQARMSVTYISVLSLAMLSACVTGMIQSIEYQKHYAGLQPYILGYGVPILFEVGLAFFAKALEGEQRNRVLDDMQQALGDNTMHAMVAAAKNIDPAIIQETAQREALRFARTAIRNTMDDLYMELQAKRKTSAQNDVAELQDLPQLQGKVEVNTPQHAVLQGKIEEINAQKRGKVEERRAQLLQMIGEGSKKLQDVVDALGVAENTIRADVKALAHSGLSIDNGVLSIL